MRTHEFKWAFDLLTKLSFITTYPCVIVYTAISMRNKNVLKFVQPTIHSGMRLAIFYFFYLLMTERVLLRDQTDILMN